MIHYTEADLQTGRRASEGDAQASGIQSTDGVEQVDNDASQRHHSHSPVSAARSGLQPGSSEMTRAFTNRDVPTSPTPSGSGLNGQARPLPGISVPESLLPQPAGSDRPSANPSLTPMVYPTMESPAIWPNFAGPPENRPQSRTTASSNTPPNMYECLPYNLYTTLQIHPQDPRQALDGNDNAQSPTSPLRDSGTEATQPAHNGSWALPGDDPRDSYDMSQSPYSPMSQYRHTGNDEGINIFRNLGNHGRNVNGRHPSTYQPVPNTNLAFMSMQQAMDPRLFPGMQHYSGAYPYQPSYQYYNATSGSAFSPSAPPGWIALPPNSMPYPSQPLGGAFHDERFITQMPRGRGRNRSRGRGRGRGQVNGNGWTDYASQQYWSDNRNSHSTQGLSVGNGHGRWLNGEDLGGRANLDKPPSQSAQHDNAEIPSEKQGTSAVTEVYPAGETVSASMAGDPDATKPGRALERKAYHPAPPANRSDWVMWVGNVPANATHEEMWKYFNRPLDWQTEPQFEASADWQGVASIFLISRSNCAFVNFKNERDLETAVAYFNGKHLRPWDPRCQPFLCRIRKADDDLKSGVGGQRGAGLHVKYIRNLRAKNKTEDVAQNLAISLVSPVVPPVSDQLLPLSPAALEEPPEGEGRRRESVINGNDLISPAAFAAWQGQQQQPGQSTDVDHSLASTSSSFLVRNFPKRYFILKSSTKDELDRSIKVGSWRTQPHNEAILDQAFRTSPEVYLIFGANKQGSFTGYAIMRSGIASVARPHTSQSAQGQDSPFSNGSCSGVSKPISGSNSRTAGLLSPRGADIQEEGDEDAPPVPRSFRLSSEDSTNVPLAMSSPGEMTPGDELTSPTDIFRWNQTAPHPDHKRISGSSDFPLRAMTFDAKALARIRAEEALKQEIAAKAMVNADSFELDQDAALKAQSGSTRNDTKSAGDVSGKDMISSDEAHAPAAVEAQRQSTVVATDRGDTNGSNGKIGVTVIGESVATTAAELHDFEVEWIRVGELPFSSIKHLRNPWNQDKEVKVSRDGTELEPVIGASLLAEWDRLSR